jgi:oligopeptide transport system substrate-binding protein
MKKVYFLLSLLIIFSSCTGFKKENVLNIYSKEYISSLDPVEVKDRHSVSVIRQIYEGLYEYHYLKEDNKLHPVLAKDMPKKINNNKYIIELKKGITFTNDACFKGKKREFKASDFIYSIKRTLKNKKAENSIVVTTLKNVVLGAKEYSEGKTNDLKGLKATDDYTIKIKTKKESPFFPGILTRPKTFIVAKEAVNYYKENFSNNPVGTGPFYLKKWEKGNKVVLLKNKNYHGKYPSSASKENKKFLKDSGKNIPFINKINFNILVEDQPRWTNFLKGNIDIVELDKDSYFDAYPIDNEFSKDLKEKKVKPYKVQKIETTFYVFNMKDKTLGKNKFLRQAISLAFDGEKYNFLFYNNIAYIANWIIPPGLFGFDPNYQNPLRKYNIAKAKKYLAKAGYPNGKGLKTIELILPESLSSKQKGRFFKKSMSDIGINIKIKTLKFTELLKKLNKQNFQIMSLQWRADLPISKDFLRIYYGGAVTPGPNMSHYQNKNYDKIFNKVYKMKNNYEKLNLISKLRDISAKDTPIIPLIHPVSTFLVHGYLENYNHKSFIKDYYKYLKINTNKRRNIQCILKK